MLNKINKTKTLAVLSKLRAVMNIRHDNDLIVNIRYAT